MQNRNTGTMNEEDMRQYMPAVFFRDVKGQLVKMQ